MGESLIWKFGRPSADAISLIAFQQRQVLLLLLFPPPFLFVVLACLLPYPFLILQFERFRTRLFGCIRGHYAAVQFRGCGLFSRR